MRKTSLFALAAALALGMPAYAANHDDELIEQAVKASETPLVGNWLRLAVFARGAGQPGKHAAVIEAAKEDLEFGRRAQAKGLPGAPSAQELADAKRALDREEGKSVEQSEHQQQFASDLAGAPDLEGNVSAPKPLIDDGEVDDALLGELIDEIADIGDLPSVERAREIEATFNDARRAARDHRNAAFGGMGAGDPLGWHYEWRRMKALHMIAKERLEQARVAEYRASN